MEELEARTSGHGIGRLVVVERLVVVALLLLLYLSMYLVSIL